MNDAIITTSDNSGIITTSASVELTGAIAWRPITPGKSFCLYSIDRCRIKTFREEMKLRILKNMDPLNNWIGEEPLWVYKKDKKHFKWARKLAKKGILKEVIREKET